MLQFFFNLETMSNPATHTTLKWLIIGALLLGGLLPKIINEGGVNNSDRRQ